MSEFIAPVNPSHQCQYGGVGHIQAPGNHLLPFMQGQNNQTLKQASDLVNIEVDEAAFALGWHTQPVECSFLLLMRVCLHDVILFHERELIFRLGDGIPLCLDAEQSYFWKRTAGGFSND